jgi:hypothetical protein
MSDLAMSHLQLRFLRAEAMAVGAFALLFLLFCSFVSQVGIAIFGAWRYVGSV